MIFWLIVTAVVAGVIVNMLAKGDKLPEGRFVPGGGDFGGHGATGSF